MEEVEGIIGRSFYRLSLSWMNGPKPNIIGILGTDVGNGDIGCVDPATRISIPSLDSAES